MVVVIRGLGEDDEVENFDCGDDALNNYLKRHGWTNQQNFCDTSNTLQRSAVTVTASECKQKEMVS